MEPSTRPLDIDSPHERNITSAQELTALCTSAKEQGRQLLVNVSEGGDKKTDSGLYTVELITTHGIENVFKISCHPARLRNQNGRDSRSMRTLEEYLLGGEEAVQRRIENDSLQMEVVDLDNLPPERNFHLYGPPLSVSETPNGDDWDQGSTFPISYTITRDGEGKHFLKATPHQIISRKKLENPTQLNNHERDIAIAFEMVKKGKTIEVKNPRDVDEIRNAMRNAFNALLDEDVDD